MGCFSFRSSKTKTPTPMKSSFSETAQEDSESKNLIQEVLLRIPGCKVHLMDEGEAMELVNGEFTVVQISDGSVSLATIVKVGEELQWPLTKDEPVVKVDALQYLFSLPMKDGDPLSYGVTFSELSGGSSLGLLDSFLKEHSCFSCPASTRNKTVDWQEFAPRVEAYNNVLAKAIAGGTGQIVKGIFVCSNAYTDQVNKGGEMILTSPAAEEKSDMAARERKRNSSTVATRKSGLNKNLKRVRKLSKTTEKISKSMLNGIGIATGAVMRPVVRSQAGKAFLAMVPGEVLLASLDAVNKILDAAEVAEKQALSATSRAATRMVSKRCQRAVTVLEQFATYYAPGFRLHFELCSVSILFLSTRYGESAGEATEDVLATAGHCAGTAWNVLKIRKALNPASSVSTGVLKNAAKGGDKKF